MSVWRWKRRIARAVAGDLSIAAEARLRRHLGVCEACRSLYDDLVATSEALAHGTGVGRAGPQRAAKGEERRLRRALTPPPSVVPRRVVVWGGLCVVPAAALVFLVVRGSSPEAPPTPETPSEITWRGAHPAEERAAALPTVLLFASPNLGKGRHGPVRMVGELPGSGESTVTTADFLQLGVRNLRRTAWPSVRVRTPSGDTRTLWPTRGSESRLDPGRKETLPLGPSLDLAASGLTGKLTLCVLLPEAPLPERERWPAACDATDATTAVHGLLLVAPAP